MPQVYQIKLLTQKNWQKDQGLKTCLHPAKSENHYFISDLGIQTLKSKKISFDIVKKISLEKTRVNIIKTFPVTLYDQPTDDAIEEVTAYICSLELNWNKINVLYLGRNIVHENNSDTFIMDRATGKRRYYWKLVPQSQKITETSIHDKFSRIQSVMNDPDTKVVLSLSGGGLKALAHTPLLRFINAMGLYKNIDEFWGTSGGSIVALWYACGISPVEMEMNGWDIYNKRFSLKHSPSKFKVLKNIFLNYVVPERFRSNNVAGFIESAQSIEDFIHRVKKDRDLKKPFYCIAFNLNDLKGEILTDSRFYKKRYKGLVFPADPIEAAIASSTVPILFVPRKITFSGKKTISYIDGGVVEFVPIKSIYDKWVFDRVNGIEKRKKLVVIISKLFSQAPIPMESCSDINELKMLKIYQSAINNVAMKSQEAILRADPNVTTITTHVPIDEIGMFDIKLMPEIFSLSKKHIVESLIQEEEGLKKKFG